MMAAGALDARDLLDQLTEDWARERPDLNASGMAVVGRIIHLADVLKTSANRALAPFDLHYTDLDVLATLRRKGAPYRLTPTELSKAVLLTSGAMTAALRRLERRHLVERAPDPNDGRGRTVTLTERGRALIDRAIAARFEEAAQAVTGLSEPDREALAGHLRTLTVSLGEL